MRIIDIEIEEFGKLSDFTLTPGRGITLIEGENESGKSTLLAFIRYMLYGFPRKGAVLDGDEREKRLSWRSRRASGCLTVEHEGATYRIFRKCVARGGAARESTLDELSVLRLPQGEELDLAGKTPGEYFLGFPVELYEGSLCLSQLNADRVCSGGMGEAVGDLLCAGDATLSAEEAEAKLQNARRDLQHLKGRGGRIAELEDALSTLNDALSHAKEDGAQLSELRGDLKRYRDQIRERKETLQTVTDALERTEIRRTLGLFEDCAKARAEADRCRITVENVGRQAAEELPDRESISRITLALRDLSVARERVALLTPEADRLSMVRHDEKLLNGAKKTEEWGGAEAVIATAAKSEKRVKRRRGWGILLLLLTLCCAVATYLLSAWRVYLIPATFALGAWDFVTWIAVLRARRHRKKLFGALGAPRNAMLRTYLEQCKREAEAYTRCEEQRAANEAALQEARGVQSSAMERLRTELQATGQETLYESPEQVAAYLETMNRRRTELQAALSEATVAFERANGVVQTLSAHLQHVSEQELRLRLAKIPDNEESPDTLKKQQSFLEQSIAGLERKRAEVERAESALSATSRDPILLERERISVTEELAAARHRLAALQMALEAMEQASHDLRQGVTPGLRQEAAALFAELTDGAHGELHLGADFSMTVVADGVPRPIRHFSVGCRDAAYLSLRLALLSVVSGTKPPLLLDEAFAHMDDGRAENLLNVLQNYCKEGGQCLLLTCHQREGELLAGDSTVKRVVLSRE